MFDDSLDDQLLLTEASGTGRVIPYRSQSGNGTPELEREQELKTSHNSTTTTCQLPIEILTTIFSFVPHLRSSNDIINVSHVCRHWRLVALECPRLWTRFQGASLLNLDLMHTMLRRSKSAPLTLIWEADPEGELLMNEPILSELLSHVGRLESVTLRGRDDNDDFHGFSSLLSEWRKAHAPLLKKLCLTNIIVDQAYYDPAGHLDALNLKRLHLPERLLQGGAPALRDLSLSHLGIPWVDIPLGENIVHLNLSEDPGFGSLCRPKTIVFMDSLKGLPRLETLELQALLPIEEPFSTQDNPLSSTLKTLKLTDSSDFLSHFLRIVRILDPVSITLAFLQDNLKLEMISSVLRQLKSSFTREGTLAEVKKFTDRDFSTIFELDFNYPDSPPEAQNQLGTLTIIGFIGEDTPAFTPEQYYGVIAQHFSLSSLRSLRFSWADLEDHEDQAWAYFRHLPLLESVTLLGCHLAPFVSQLEIDPILCVTPRVHQSGKQCYFPALKTLHCAPSSPPELGWHANLKQCLTRLSAVLNARRQLGIPLQAIHLDKRVADEEELIYLREAVTGLSVFR